MLKKLIVFAVFLFCIQSLHADSQRKFVLKDGTVITGELISFDETSKFFNVSTNYGEIKISIDDIDQNYLIIELMTGDIFKGVLINETQDSVIINTDLGILTVNRSDIKRMDHESVKPLEDDDYWKKKDWYYGENNLIDMFFDPTAHVLQKETFYISLLSWGVGLSDRFQITTKFWQNFSGNYNLRPKFQFLNRGDYKKRWLVAGGFHHFKQVPDSYKRWDKEIVDEHSLTELFLASTWSLLNSRRQGRTEYTIGARTTLSKYEPFNRVYAGIATDISPKLKGVAEIFYDENWHTDNQSYHFDYGLIYKMSDNFHFGVHQQPYVFVLYWML